MRTLIVRGEGVGAGSESDAVWRDMRDGCLERLERVVRRLGSSVRRGGVLGGEGVEEEGVEEADEDDDENEDDE
jgi:hypothetical protein